MTSMQPQLDYSQHLAAYLGAWRQLLESLAVIASVPPPPAVPWGMPAMGIVSPALPLQPAAAPADPAQQLFGQLQAWRQYLEQAVAGPTAATNGQAAQENWPNGRPPVHPTREDAGKVRADAPTSFPGGGNATAATVATAAAASGTGSGGRWPPDGYVLRPANDTGTQWPDNPRTVNAVEQLVSPIDEDSSDEARSGRLVQAAPAARGEQVLLRPWREDSTEAGKFRWPNLNLGSAAAPSAPQEALQRPQAVAPGAVSSPLFKGLAERAQLNQNLGR